MNEMDGMMLGTPGGTIQMTTVAGKIGLTDTGHNLPHVVHRHMDVMMLGVDLLRMFVHVLLVVKDVHLRCLDLLLTIVLMDVKVIGVDLLLLSVHMVPLDVLDMLLPLVARERTSSEERLQRGGQGPIRQGRRNQRARAWEDGSFRAAVFRHGVDRSSPEAAEARRKLALLLGVPNQGGPAWGPQPWAAWESWTSGPPMWSAQQWANWEQWTSNPAMVVDWSGSGVPPIWHVRFEDDDDDGSFVQLDVCPSGGCSVDELDLMQLTGAEEELLAEIHLPDNLRRDLREMLYTLQRHSDEDLGPEFRWGLQEWLQAWSDGCRRTEQIVNCLRRRVDSSGVVPYWPVVRGPRHAAHRVRSLSWNRQWTRVVCGIVEAMVDLLMVQHINLVPTDPEVAPTRPVTTPSRSRSRDGGDDATGAASSSSSTGRFRVRRVRRRVGTADVPGVSSAASADSAASSSLPVTGEAPGAAVDAVPVPAGSSTPLVAPDTLVDAGVEPTVTEDVALVQRLQPSEAQELARLGFRRECISAIGLFLGNLASIVEGVQPAGDLPAGDVQWCLRVVDTAIQNVMEAQDYVSTLLGRRITGGDCVLPDGAARGPGCQLSHTMVVSMARAVLDGLHERVANAWLDPEGLPPELRRDPALFVDDFGELGGYGDGDDGDATADEARVETVENVDVPALSSTDVPATASSMGVARRRSLAIVHHGVAATSSQPASVSPTGVPSANAGRVPADGHSGAGRDRSRSPRGESEEDVSNLMQRLDQAEGELLRETGMPRCFFFAVFVKFFECVRVENVHFLLSRDVLQQSKGVVMFFALCRMSWGRSAWVFFVMLRWTPTACRSVCMDVCLLVDLAGVNLLLALEACLRRLLRCVPFGGIGLALLAVNNLMGVSVLVQKMVLDVIAYDVVDVRM
ncbi:unnamed protein product [Symbiodinium microadriaticum]|nr:unnamed protein product [Symbiodinium microadriaticum]